MSYFAQACIIAPSKNCFDLLKLQLQHALAFHFNLKYLCHFFEKKIQNQKKRGSRLGYRREIQMGLQMGSKLGSRKGTDRDTDGGPKRVQMGIMN